MRLCGSRRGLVAAVAVSLVAVGTVSGGAVVHAAPPSNDDLAGATVIDAIPFHAQQDTTEATTSAEEAAWNDFCGAPTLEQGVWFTATVMNDASNVVVDTTASDYSAGILVLVGDPGALQPVACQPGIVSGPVGAGQTVYLLIFGDGLTGTTSGNLVLDIYPAPPPPEIDVAIDPVGTFDRSGAARISGTVTCTSADPTATVIDLSGSVRQAVGRFAIDGFFFVDLFSPCDGTTQPWEAFVTGNGKFKGGHAATVAVAFGCDSLTCVDGFAEATVKLRGGK